MQADMSREMKKHVSQTAHLNDPRKTAFSIYFVVKQYNISKSNRRVYVDLFKDVKKMLILSFNWSMIDVHSCFCHLNQLMGYVPESKESKNG